MFTFDILRRSRSEYCKISIVRLSRKGIAQVMHSLITAILVLLVFDKDLKKEKNTI